MNHLRQLLSTSAQFDHIIDRFAAGAKDDAWIPAIAAAGGWIVITADAGKRPTRGEAKLPKLCREFRITHVVLSAALHIRPASMKAAAIAQLWPEIIRLGECRAGTRFNLRYKTLKGKVGLTVSLDKMWEPPDEGNPSE